MVSDSYILIPNHIIVNKEAVGGSQATKESIPVEAANTSTVSFTDSSTAILLSPIYQGVPTTTAGALDCSI